jgi:integrase/recombinase XerD
MKPSHLVKRYLRHLRNLHRAPTTITGYRDLIGRFEAFALSHGIRTWSAVTPPLILEYQSHVAGLRGRRGVPYVPAVRNLHLIVLRGLFRYLEMAGDVKCDPTRGIELAREPVRLPRTVPTPREMKRLMQAPDTGCPLGLRDRALLETLYSTGMRRMEIVAVELHDVDPDHRVMAVRLGKGGKDRVVPFGKVAGRYLQAYIEKARPLLLRGQKDCGRVFLSATGGRLCGRAIGYLVERYARVARIAVRITPHVFRHACATDMIRNRANVRHVQQMLGHAKLETTERYLHLTILDLKDAHRRFHPRERDDGRCGGRFADTT